MARWNIQCQTCQKIEFDVPCSMFSIPACPTCQGERVLAPVGIIPKSAIFPFTLNHVDGKPMTIESMYHLRQVEKDYGVVFSAFSHASSNNVDPVSSTLPKYRGEDPEIRRKYRR